MDGRFWLGATRELTAGCMVITSVPHICRNLLASNDLWQTDFSRSDAQIGTDISITTRCCVEKFARDVRKVRCKHYTHCINWRHSRYCLGESLDNYAGVSNS